MPTYERVDYGSDDGAQLGGAATDKIGFYGATPVVKATLEQLASTRTTTQLRAELSALQNALASLGLITVT
jgi:hypothetical protein